MRAVLTSFGSTGDFEPFLALAIEMKRRGQEPVLACLPQFASRAAVHGIEFVSTGTSALFEAMQHSQKTEMAHGASNVEHLSHYPAAEMVKAFGDLFRACNGADALVCSAEWPFGRMIHELTDIAFASVHLDHFNEEFAKESREPIAAWEEQLAAFVNPFRKRLGLRELHHMLTTDGNSEQLALFAMSRLILDPAKEEAWPSHHHVTGFFFVDEEGWSPDEKLAEFIEAGEPPVVFTFGSMVYDNTGLAELLFDVIGRIDCRMILQHGWGELFQGRSLPPNAQTIDFVPYGWLFPRASCVVQTGGAGTTAWAMRSGTPTVCVPHLYQQFSYAEFAKAYGCGLVVPHRELSVGRLSGAVVETLTDSRYRSCAREVSEQMKVEGGARRAAQLIERWYDGLPESRRPSFAKRKVEQRAKTRIRPAL